LRRILYFFYYLKQTSWPKFCRFLKYASEQSGQGRFSLLTDAIFSTFRYNISLLDYFYFRFYGMNHPERTLWAGTGYLYEYQLRMNPRGSREVLENKIRFLEHFKSFVKRSFASFDELKLHPEKAETLLNNPSGRLVLKGSGGQVGAEVEVVSCKDYSPESLMDFMMKKKYDLAEEYVVQHPTLMEMSPSGLNTVRIFTQLSEGNVDFLGARLRISVNSSVDNMAAGNLAAALNIETGEVVGPGVYSNITKADESVHPVTGKAITGFVVPFWKEILEMTTSAALHFPHNRSVGWDIAITADGPELIEGNHNWCKLLWQLPVKKGLKFLLEKYME
jgi:hypothetical protein